MARATTPQPQKRKGFWYLIRRVPDEFRSVEKRAIVFISTGIPIPDDPHGMRARQQVTVLNEDLVSAWMLKRDGTSPDPRRLYERNAAMAQQHQLPYLEAPDVAQLPKSELYGRLDVVKDNPSEEMVSALLGGVPKPLLMVSAMLDEYEAIMEPALRVKSPRQKTRWRNEREKATSDLLEALGGDMAFITLTRDHGLKYRDLWKSRILKDNVNIETANKNIGRVSAMTLPPQGYPI